MSEPADGASGGGGSIGSTLVDAAAVTAGWGVALLAENAAMAFLWRAQFLGPWEVSLARHAAAPLALAGLAPASLVVAGLWRLALAAESGDGARARRARGAFAGAGVLAAAAVGMGVTGGRHFANLGLRALFVAALALGGAYAGSRIVPRVASLSRAPVALGVLGLTLACAGWLGDAYILPRLYPAFHVALLATCLVGAALAALAGRAGAGRPSKTVLALAGGVAALAGVCGLSASKAVRSLDRDANLRIVLVEHAPLAGRAVAVAEQLSPPPEDSQPSAATTTATGEVARSLDWTGHDLVVLTVDALRADHLGAYGYARPTSPNIDALAAEGTLFDSAYCPTPHTSYSLTSMMTGKYLRPLLALGLGEDSETWAQDLRRYGWRTAAFYPPAVFFIDQDRFTRFENEHLGFEYAKVEFADPELRERQVRGYLDSAPADRPLFLWVHFFEPHEPYVVHPGHVFHGGASADLDAYDSEIAEADDGIGRIVRLVRARHPGPAGPVIVVTADHGEEFGEHGGRYHGTTVYEEQVRVPLVVVGPGVRAGSRAASVAQTIDLLPTALSALGIPRPARLRGRDLGSDLAASPRPAGEAAQGRDGLALAETDDYELLASGPDRLVCERRAAACALYRPVEDPTERHDLGPGAPARLDAMRALLRATVRDHGRYEATGASPWPEALRRGLQGDVEAAVDVASLLEDADVTIRRKAAEVSFALHAEPAIAELGRAAGRDEDESVRSWAALALVRAGAPASAPAQALLRAPAVDWRRRAALAFGERGDSRACEEIAMWWAEVAATTQTGGADGEPPRLTIELRDARDLLGATGRARCRGAVPGLVHALDDVRARPYVVDTLAALGDDRARGPLLGLLGAEPYVSTRPHEARALLALGVEDWTSPAPVPQVRVTLDAPSGPVRVVALLSDASAKLELTSNGEAPVARTARDGGRGAGEAATDEGEVRVLDFPGTSARRLHLEAHASEGGLVAIWLLSAAGLD